MGVLSKIIYHSYNYKQSGINQPLNLTLNDLVLVKDDNLTRLKWKLGRVIEVYRRDEVSRSAKIKLSQTTLIPPVNKLCILENVKWNVQMISFSLGVEDISTENSNI